MEVAEDGGFGEVRGEFAVGEGEEEEEGDDVEAHYYGGYVGVMERVWLADECCKDEAGGGVDGRVIEGGRDE